MVINSIILGGDFLKNNIPNDSIDLIITDPPYKTTKRGSSGDTGGMLATELSREGIIFENNDLNIEEYIDELYRVLKPNSHLYIMTNNKNLRHFLNVMNESKFKVFKTLIWYKNAPITNMWYMDTHEYIIFARKGKAVRINNCGTKSVLEVPIVKDRLHPTQKPIELMKILIENSSKIGDIVLDPFAGVGTTLIAAQQLKRNYLGYEIDPQYHQIAEKLLNKESEIKVKKEVKVKKLKKLKGENKS